MSSNRSPNDRFTIISDEISQDLAPIAAFVREFGLSGIELRSLFGRAFKDLTDADVAEVRRRAQGEGWKIHGCSTPVFKCEIGDAAAIKEHRRLFERAIEVAGRLECTLLRVFTFLRQPGPRSADDARRIADQLRPLAELARKAGMRLGIENESSCQIATARECGLLFAEFSEPGTGLIWDPCNVFYTVEGQQEDLVQGYAALAPRIIHIHVKDTVRAPDTADLAKAAVVGEGDVDWKAQLAAIRRSGYQGLLSLETHWRKVALDTTLLHLPAGHAFSAGGEEASRICMERLLALWK